MEIVAENYHDDDLLGTTLGQLTLTIFNEVGAYSETEQLELMELTEKGDHKAVFQRLPKTKKSLELLHKRNPFVQQIIINPCIFALPDPEYSRHGKADEAIYSCKLYSAQWFELKIPIALIAIFPWPAQKDIDEEDQYWFDLLDDISEQIDDSDLDAFFSGQPIDD